VYVKNMRIALGAEVGQWIAAGIGEGSAHKRGRQHHQAYLLLRGIPPPLLPKYVSRSI
jgi:hypothetical protein